MRHSVLQAFDITKTISSRVVLDCVSLDLKAGATIGLIGANGAGKTTLLKILAGSLNPSKGHINISGGSALLLPDRPAFMPRLTVIETMQCFVSSCGVQGGNVTGRISAAIKTSGLEDCQKSRTSDLSSGLRQRLSWCYALLLTPSVVLLDEPTSFLDPIGVFSLREIVRLLSERGCGIIISSHHLDEISRMSNTIIALRSGKLHAVSQAEISEVSSGQPNRIQSLLVG